MWDCQACGCQAIARDLAFCPMCATPKEGEEMPKATSGGPSSAWEPDQPEQEQAAPEQVQQPPEQPNADDDKSDYASYALKDLVEICKARGIAYSGTSGTLTKAELVSRLEEADRAA